MFHARHLFAAALLCVAPIVSLSAQGAVAPSTTRAPADTARSKGVQVDGVAAIVGDQVILISEVLAEVNRRRAGGAAVNNAADLAQLQSRVVEELVEAELLVQKAKSEKIEANDADVTRTLNDNQQKVRSQFQTDVEFRAALKEAGFGSLDEWRKMQTDLIKRDNMQRDLVQKLRRDGKMTAVNVSETEVSDAFTSNKERLPRKEARVGFRQIVIATRPSEGAKQRARAKADSVRAELELHPNDFETIAKKESMDPASRELGGDLGWNRRGRMVAEFDRVMFGLNPGVISPVFESSFGYHIVRVDRVQPAEVKARHILISWALDSADEKRSKIQADSITTAWRKGASFDSLSVRFHDLAGGEEKTIPEYPRDSLPQMYRNAIEGHKLHDILDPFPIPSGSSGVNKFVIAEITFLDEAGAYTLPEMRVRIRAQLSEERSMRRLIDALKKQTYISIRYDPAKVVDGIVPQ